MKRKWIQQNKNIYINRYKSTDENLQGINFFIRNINTNKIWTSNYYKDIVKPSKYKAIFKPDSNTIERTDGNIETKIDVTVSQNVCTISFFSFFFSLLFV